MAHHYGGQISASPFWIGLVRSVKPLRWCICVVSLCECVCSVVVRRRSVLDQWLMIVALAATAELALASLSSGRFTLGFYAGRMFSVITSTAVLGVLLAETTKLYGQLARSNMLLRRERKNKLVSMEAMAASISHELNQPLTAISMNGEAGLSYLEKVMPPHLEEVGNLLDLIVRDSHRAGQILLSVRALLGKRRSKQKPVHLNEIVADRALWQRVDRRGYYDTRPTRTRFAANYGQQESIERGHN